MKIVKIFPLTRVNTVAYISLSLSLSLLWAVIFWKWSLVKAGFTPYFKLGNSGLFGIKQHIWNNSFVVMSCHHLMTSDGFHSWLSIDSQVRMWPGSKRLIACLNTKATRCWKLLRAQKRHAVTGVTVWLSCCVDFLAAAFGLCYAHRTLLWLIHEKHSAYVNLVNSSDLN